jgi:sugar phosphate isomerase/epimerase
MNGKPAELSNCNSDRALPGQGVLDLRAIYGAIEQHGYNGFFSIEMFSDELWSLPAHEAAQQMYDSLLTLCND